MSFKAMRKVAQNKGSQKKKAVKSKGKKAAPAKPKPFREAHSHLFPKRTRNFKIGNDIQPKRDLSRFVKWPRYIRLQRQRVILKKRIKVPPAIHQFTKTLHRNAATNLFRLLAHYRPETPKQKKQRLMKQASEENKGNNKVSGQKPHVVKFGINHVTELIESRRAKLVVIAHDVDPIELVLWLPALCRQMDVPYVIVKGKARLGHLIHQKKATALALTSVNKEHQKALDQLISVARPMYNDAVGDLRKWGGRIMGNKTRAVIRKRLKEERAAAAKASKFS